MPSTFALALRRLLILAALATMMVASAFASPKFRIIRTFAGGNDASFPSSQLTFDSAGNLYGTSFYGGSITDCGGYGCGTVFRLTPKNGHWVESVLANFAGATSQVGPSGPLVIDSVGNVFGTGTSFYYDNGQVFLGQLFQVLNNRGSYTESALHLFVGGTNDGADSNAGLVRDSAGNLYGSAQAGGDLNNNGVIFQFSPNGDGTWTESFPYQFGQGKSYIPTGNMIIDKAGNLYGTTAAGGAYGYGSVYKLSQANGVWTIESIYDFTPSPNYGQYPTPGALVMDAAGNLYGNTQYDGFYGVGSLYKLTPTVGYWTYSLIHSFTGSTDGGYPAGALAVDPNGSIYGTTYSGGVFQYGTVYKFVHGAKGNWNQAVMHNFSGTTDGYQPQGVLLDSLGNLYGVAEYGGTNLAGVAYEITP